MSTKANLKNMSQLATPEEQKAEMLKRLGNIDLEIRPTEILTAVYVEPEMTSGGIYKADSTITEGRYQGKCALIIKMGAAAFKYDGNAKWEGPAPEVGDWIFFRVADAWDLDINGVACRIIDHDLYKGRITDPALIW